jgi:Mg2+ and Co2+ transporter CorA
MVQERQSSPGTGDQDLDLLPRSIFVPSKDPHAEYREIVYSLLSDRFMAFLSLLLLPIIILPLVISLPDTILSFFDICDVMIILFFVVEYVLKLYLAESSWDYFRSPWHLLDLTVIILSFVSYVPLVGLTGKGSALLLVRLLRLPRAFAIGGRTATSRIKKEDEAPAAPQAKPEVVIRQIGASNLAEAHTISWGDLQKRLTTDEQEWIDLTNASESDVLRLGTVLRVHERNFNIRQVDEVHPHVGRVQRMVLIFLHSGEVRYPERASDYFTIARRGVIIIYNGPKIISVSPHKNDLFSRVQDALVEEKGDHGFVVSVLHGILDANLKDYRNVISEIEMEVSRIANTPRSKLPRDFLQRMYQLNKATLRLTSNMVHFKEVLGRLVSGRVPLEGAGDEAKQDFETLSDELSYLNEIADDVSESLKTVTEVYINQSSFETNRILKIIALITSLSVIPATVGGLLGIDGPYDFVLWQVVLVLAISMMFIAYCFAKLGWLKG